jgi:hypothetical protein
VIPIDIWNLIAHSVAQCAKLNGANGTLGSFVDAQRDLCAFAKSCKGMRDSLDERVWLHATPGTLPSYAQYKAAFQTWERTRKHLVASGYAGGDLSGPKGLRDQLIPARELVRPRWAAPAPVIIAYVVRDALNVSASQASSAFGITAGEFDGLAVHANPWKYHILMAARAMRSCTYKDVTELARCKAEPPPTLKALKLACVEIGLESDAKLSRAAAVQHLLLGVDPFAFFRKCHGAQKPILQQAGIMKQHLPRFGLTSDDCAHTFHLLRINRRYPYGGRIAVYDAHIVQLICLAKRHFGKRLLGLPRLRGIAQAIGVPWANRRTKVELVRCIRSRLDPRGRITRALNTEMAKHVEEVVLQVAASKFEAICEEVCGFVRDL